MSRACGCRYWQIIEQNGFDPVSEYNKSVEEFEIHFHPSNEDIVKIILQLSRFFKEFGDFEIFLTPQFRHPPIRGAKKDLEDIGIMGELRKLNLMVDSDLQKGAQILTEIENLSADNPNSRSIIRNHYFSQAMQSLTEKDAGMINHELSKDVTLKLPKPAAADYKNKQE